MAADSGGQRTHKINAEDVKRHIRRRDFMFEPRVGPSVTFSDQSGLESLLNGVKHIISITAGAEPLVVLLYIPLADLDMDFHDSRSAGQSENIGKLRGTNQLVEHPIFDLKARGH